MKVVLSGHLYNDLGFPLYVEEHGEGQNPVMLFIHGYGQSSQCWRRQIDFFAQNSFVLSLDLPFHGFSGPLKSQEAGTIYEQSVRFVVEKYSLEDKGFIPVVWSMGGLVLSRYILEYGSKGIVGIVLAATTLDFEQVPSAEDTMKSTLLNLLSRDVRIRAGALLHFVDALQEVPPEQTDYLLTFGYNAQAILRDAPLPDLVRFSNRGSSFVGELPVLAIHGVHDALLPFESIVPSLASINNLQVVAYDCGHSPFLEEPDRFNRDVDAFQQKIWVDRALAGSKL